MKLYKIIFAVAMLYVFAIPAYSQFYFQRSYDTPINSGGDCIRLLSDGGYIVAGRQNGSTTDTYGAVVLRLDDTGDTLWTKVFQTNNVYSRTSIIPVTSGGFLMTAGYDFAGILAIRLNDMGDTLWTQSYTIAGGGEMPVPVETTDGGFAIAGLNGFQPYLFRIDVNGNLLWNIRYSGTGGSVTENKNPHADLLLADDGGFVIVGNTKSSGMAEANAIIIKTDASGAVEWTTITGGDGEDDFKGVTKLENGGYAAVGHTTSFGSTGTDVYLATFDSLGTLKWAKKYGGIMDQSANAVIENSNGDLIICGFSGAFFSAGDANRPLLFSTDSTGMLLWSNKGNDAALLYDCDFTANGGIAITGFGYSGTSPITYHTIFSVADSMGNFCEAQPFSLNAVALTPVIANTYQTYTMATTTNYIPEIESPEFTLMLDCKPEQVGLGENQKPSIVPMLYPQPANEYVQISLNEDFDGPASLEIYTMSGQLVNSIDQFTGVVTLPTANLPAGIYTVILRTMNETSQQKLIISH